MEEHSQRSHALLSASGSSRWLNCTPSARLEDAEPKHEASVYAAEGTLAHEIAEVFLRRELGLLSPDEGEKVLESLRANPLYYDGMEEDVDAYVHYCLDEFKQLQKITQDAKITIEERVDLTRWIPEAFGSNDCVIIADSVLSVIDLKFGKGVRVNADDNSQLKLYGLGTLYRYALEYDVRTVRLAIIQPRLDHISVWEISAEELLKWGETVVEKQAALAWEGKGDLKPGSWCQWCKVKAKCSALAEKCLDDAKVDFSEPDKKPATLSDSDILHIYKSAKMIYSWLEAVEDFVLQQALEGKSWEGFKLVEGRSVRRFADEEAVKAALDLEGIKAEDYLVTKLAAMGVIEKLVGKKRMPELLGDLIVKPEGKPTLVPLDDKRAPLNRGAAVDFA